MPPKGIQGKAVKDSIKVLENAQLIQELRKKDKGFGEMCGDIRQVCCFALFVFLFTFLVLTEPLTEMYAFEHSIRTTFETPSHETEPRMHLEDVTSIQGVWQYVDQTLMPALYHPEFAKLNNMTRPALALDKYKYNAVVGRVRFRVVNVKQGGSGDNCKISSQYQDAFRGCYGPASPNYESRGDYGEKPPLFQWKNAAELEGVYHQGKLATYSSNGFTEFLSSNKTMSNQLIENWYNNDYLGIATRALFIDFNVWNSNKGHFGSVKIVFEMSPTGSFINSLEFVVITPKYLELSLTMDEAFELALLFLVAYYIAQEVSELTISRADYLSDGWNLLDWANLIILIYVQTQRVMCILAVKGSKKDVFAQVADPTKFMDCTHIGGYIQSIRNWNAFNSVLIWFKTVKYITFIPYVTTMMDTIKFSWKYFISFTIIFLCNFLGFSFGITGGLGDKIQEVNTWTKSALFLSRAFIGSVSFADVYEAQNVLGGIFICAFIVFIFFICLNLFMAIMVVALSEAKAQQEQSTESPWLKFKKNVRTISNSIWAQLEIDDLIARYFKGLDARRKIAAEKQYDLELRRQDRFNKLEERRRRAEGKPPREEEDEFDDGGPESPNAGRTQNAGRRPKGTEDTKFGGHGNAAALPSIAGEQAEAEESESNASEVDIGVLSSSKVKLRKKKISGGNTESELILQSVQHIATVLARRSDTVKEIVIEEMREVKMICSVISDVLDILARRAGDLGKQQTHFLETLGYGNTGVAM